MLHWIARLLAEHHTFFHVFSYQTMRGILAVATALGLSLCLGPWMIDGTGALPDRSAGAQTTARRRI